MKQLAAAALAVSLGLVWPFNDSSAASMEPFRGHGRYGWHRTHFIAHGTRAPSRKHTRARRKLGRLGKASATHGKPRWHSAEFFPYRKQKRHRSFFRGRGKRRARRKYILVQRRHPGFFRSFIPIYYSSRPDVRLDDSNLQKQLILKEIVSGGVGRQMNNRDRVWLARITQVALEKTPTGAVTEWSNPDSEIKGTISPLSTFRSDQAKSCREFQQTVSFGGVTEIAYGVACRQKDGSWKIVK